LHTKIINYLSLSLIIILPTIVCAAPPMPARIGGTISVNGTALNQLTDSGYTVVVTKQDGTAPIPAAQDLDGLNGSDFYIIDVPIYSQTEQAGGINTGDVAKLHVYKNDEELTISSPSNGNFTVGASGTTTQIDINLSTSSSVSMQGALFILLD
jgi:hypothetical protein